MPRDPETLRFARSHEWVALEGTRATLGISQHAQDALGDIVYVELPDLGRSLAVGEAFGVVESVKAASDVYTPLAGRVSAVNTTLGDRPEVINQDPHGEGWMIELEVSAEAGQHLQELMTHQQYDEMLGAGAH